MSAFQVVVTPTRVRMAQKMSAAREPTIATMAPFSAKSVVTFDDIPVTKTARRFLNIANPYPESLQVEITKTLKPETDVLLNWTSGSIPANSSISIEIVWTPQQEITTKDSIQLTDDRHFRKDVMFFFKSVDHKKTKANLKKNLSRPASTTVHLVQKKPKTKVAFSPRARKISTELVSVASRRFTGMSRPSETQKPSGFEFTVDVIQSMKRPALTKSPLLAQSTNVGNRMSPVDSNRNAIANKENRSPTTPTNASALFDQICFTPASVQAATKPTLSHIDYLASLPTPTQKTVHRVNFNMSQEIMQRSFESPTKVNLIESPPRTYIANASILCSLDTPSECGTNFASTSNVQPMLDQDTSLRRDMFDEHPPNKTYNVPDRQDSPSVSPCVYRRINSPVRSPRLSNTTRCSPLSMIQEEDTAADRSVSTQKTFNITPPVSVHVAAGTNLLQDINLVGTPLRKKFQSMRDLNDTQKRDDAAALKDNQGSMPNLHQIVTMKPIENNRYFYQSLERDQERDQEHNRLNSSTTSIVSVQFRETEILAQSSQININRCDEQQTPSTTSFFIDGIVKTSSTTKTAYNFRVPTSTKTLSLKRRGVDPTPPPSSSSSPVSKRERNESVKARRRISEKFSPPKRSRFDTDTSNHFQTSSSSSSPRSDRNSSRANKSSSFASNLSGSNKFKMPKFPVQKLIMKRQAEERVILYDAELHIQGVINPDPFAATTTSDPFLAATMYLDHHCVEKHMEHFKKWLNALVTIPADLEYSSQKKIDFGALFNEVRTKDVHLAQSKEVVSSNYFTKYRLDGLRRAAIKLYTSQAMRQPFEKLVVHIERRYIAIRADRDLHLDMVLQRDILELLLCFNPLWLRLGLEVIYGESISMQNNGDLLPLSTFILNRVFRDCYMEAMHHRSYTRSEEYAAYIKKFTLKKIMMLLFFLDMAKNNRIVTHNPCLFLKSSEFKDVKSVVLRFASTMLANLGDIQRDLRRIGIVFTHKQSYLDEFDYAFRNLTVDLRDGVRLTRVMEIILMRDDLAPKLRVPAISRLQRVYNVDLALKALADANYVITGRIAAADIADGHREKTLSLLWQIIYKFRAPKFNAAAITLQSWWRRSWLRVCIQRRIRHKQHLRRIRATIVIQAAFRSYIARRYCQIYRAERTDACVRLQSATRRVLAMRHYRFQITCIVRIQRWYKQTIQAKQVRRHYLNMQRAAVFIQQHYRRLQVARHLEQAAIVIRHIQSEARMRHDSVVVLQQYFRASIAMRRQRQEFVTLKIAAIRCQKRYRETRLMRSEQTAYCKLRTATITIQRRFRSVLQMRLQQSEYVRKRAAIVCLQSHVRALLVGRRVRDDAERTKRAVIRIQCWYRAHIARRRQQHHFVVVRHAIVVIQQRFRATIHMRLQRIEYTNIRRATIVLQTMFRALVAMRTERKRYQHLRLTTISLQRQFRNRQSMLVQRAAFLELRTAVIAVQARFRANRKMLAARIAYHGIRNATVCIQQRYRAQFKMEMVRSNYIELRSSCITIQRWFRAILAGRKQCASYQRLRLVTVIVQRKWRAKLTMRHHLAEYTQLRLVVVFIQRKFRAYRLGSQMRQNFVRLRMAAVVVQRRFRARQLMQKELAQYTIIRRSVCVIQTRRRAQLAMRTVRQHFILIKQMTIRIQQRFRATLWMHDERKHYLVLRKATVVVQRTYLAIVCMRRQRNEYRRLRAATILVQRQFRANRLAKEQRDHFVWMRSAAVKVQRFFRGFRQMRHDQTEFNRLQTVTQTIQRHFKAHMLRKQQRFTYLKLRASSICIQRQFRATLAMREDCDRYRKLKAATITTQRRFRANLLAKQQRRRYVQLLHSTRTIQQRFRAQISMQRQRADFIRMRQACICIQRHFRAHQLRKVARIKYLYIRAMVVRIQLKLRATIAMTRQRITYVSLISAVLLCQQRFRAKQSMQRQRQIFQQQRQAACCLQQRYRALVAMRMQRQHYVRLQWATRLCQRRHRADILMMQQRCEFLWIRSVIINVQTRFRGKLLTRMLRMRFVTLKRSVITIQRHFRATQLMQFERKAYTVTVQRICFVQRTFRAKIAMRKEHNAYQALRNAAIQMQRRFRATQTMRCERQRFLQLCTATVRIQRQYRCRMLMRYDCSAFQTLKVATIRIQRQFRAQMAMRFERTQFVTLKLCAIQLQRRFRAHQKMCVARQLFQCQRMAAIRIQRRFRAFLMQRQQRNAFLALRTIVVRLQRRFRARQRMIVEHNEFVRLRSAVLTVQRRFRSNRLARQMAGQYKLIRCLVICVQRKFRANRAMRAQRSQFCRLRACVVFVQQKFRGHRLMVAERHRFLDSRKTIIGLQTQIRGFLARRNYQARFTPEMLEHKRQLQACRTIQKVWRGFKVRQKATHQLQRICKNVKKANENAQPQNRLRNRITCAMRMLKDRYNISDALRILNELVKISREVPQTLLDEANFIGEFCYDIMSQAIRSEADKQLIELSSRVILNLARYEPTRLPSFKKHSLVTVAQMLLRWGDKESGIFNTLCTVIWVYSHCPDMKKIIRDYMTTHEALFMLADTKRMVIRKENMRRNRAPNPLFPKLTPQQRRQMPMLKPDYGLKKPSNQVYVFNCSIFALDTILHKLAIHVRSN